MDRLKIPESRNARMAAMSTPIRTLVESDRPMDYPPHLEEVAEVLKPADPRQTR
jgi:hypothetical protein